MHVVYCICFIVSGIAHQTNRIPIRFFVENIREGYQIIFTGKLPLSIFLVNLYSTTHVGY